MEPQSARAAHGPHPSLRPAFDCLIFNFVATNTIEGRVLQRLLEKLQEIRDALDDDAVFNVVGEILPAAHVERVLRDYYAGRLGEADHGRSPAARVDEGRFRAICQNALEGLASKKLNLEMLIERRALAQERRLVPETIARFLSESAEHATFALKAFPSLPHAFDPGRTPTTLKRYENQPDWKLPPLATRYPRLSTDRETAEKNSLEWVTPGHPLFEALRRHTLSSSQEPFGKGACYLFSSARSARAHRFLPCARRRRPGRCHPRALFAVEIANDETLRLQEPGVVGNFTPYPLPAQLPIVASVPEATDWLNQHALTTFLKEVGKSALAKSTASPTTSIFPSPNSYKKSTKRSVKPMRKLRKRSPEPRDV